MPPHNSLSGEFIRYASGVCALQLFPQALENCIDILLLHAMPVLVVSHLSYHVSDGNHKAERDLATLARSRKIACRSTVDGDSIAIARSDFVRLLEGIWQIDFHCWDAARVPLPSLLAQQAELIGSATQGFNCRPALHLIDGAQLVVDSHDNDSLHIESRSAALLRSIFAQALETIVVNVIAAQINRLPRSIHVAPLPMAIIEYFESALPAFIIRGNIPSSAADLPRLDFASADGSTEQIQPLGYLDYEPLTGQWRQQIY